MRALLFTVLRTVRFLLDWGSDLVYALLYEWHKSQVRIPPISDVLLLDSASTLAAKIREGRVSSQHVLDVYRKRLAEVNPSLNCVVDQRFAEAMKEAREADALVSGSDPHSLAQTKPFLGVPFTTKDCFSVRGLSWTAGLLRRKGKKAEADAEVVTRMKDAGAIVIGVTNVSELCMWYESSNRLYCRTSNPYHTGRIVGGSSGGEACVIAGAASVFGIGSDVGGSIRMPAFFCGIFGHKPSGGGVVPNDGQLPQAVGLINEKLLTTGPMCRFACDLLPMFKILAGTKMTAKLRLEEPVDVRKLKVFYMADDGGNALVTKVAKDMRRAQGTLVHRLETSLGVKCKETKIKGLLHSFLVWANQMASEPSAPSFSALLTELEGEIHPAWELLKWVCFKSSDHTLPAIGLAIMEKFTGPDHPDHPKMLRLCDDIKTEMELLLGDDGIFLYPTHPTTAPYHGQPLLKPFNVGYTAIFNALELPVTQVPLGLSEETGMPLGMQLIAGKNRDRNSLALAQEIEHLFGGWVPPTGVI